MLSTFNSVKPFLKAFYKNISVDNGAFKFHYRYTFLILLLSSVLVTSRQYIGEHIKCIVGNGVPEHVIETFCFFTSTFTMVRQHNETLLRQQSIPHPGVGPGLDTDPVKHHAYYQWVPFVLFLQALAFYMPHKLWKSMEGERIRKFVDGLQKAYLSNFNQKDKDLEINSTFTIPSKVKVENRISKIKTSFLGYVKVNNFWAYKLILCEFLNLLNVLFQVYITNQFLGGEFYQLGKNFLIEDFKGLMDCLDIVFPKMTKCHFNKYGPSGSIQKFDALCVMALNVINEKIFVFLWFWYLVVIGVSVLALIWRFLTFLLHSLSKKFNKILFSFACPGYINPTHIKTVTKHLPYSSWLFLYYLAKNMDSTFFKQLLRALADEIETIDENSSPILKKNSKLPVNDTKLSNEEEKSLLKKQVNFEEIDKQPSDE